MPARLPGVHRQTTTCDCMEKVATAAVAVCSVQRRMHGHTAGSRMRRLTSCSALRGSPCRRSMCRWCCSRSPFRPGCCCWWRHPASAAAPAAPQPWSPWQPGGLWCSRRELVVCRGRAFAVLLLLPRLVLPTGKKTDCNLGIRWQKTTGRRLRLFSCRERATNAEPP